MDKPLFQLSTSFKRDEIAVDESYIRDARAVADENENLFDYEMENYRWDEVTLEREL